MGEINPTSVISFSIDLQTQIKLAEYSKVRGISRSSAVRYLLKLGFVYDKILDDQQKDLVAGVENGKNLK